MWNELSVTGSSPASSGSSQACSGPEMDARRSRRLALQRAPPGPWIGPGGVGTTQRGEGSDRDQFFLLDRRRVNHQLLGVIRFASMEDPEDDEQRHDTGQDEGR